MTRAYRYVWCVAAVVAALGSAPRAASAHGSGPQIPDAAYYRAEITGSTPAVPGITAKVDTAGEWIELSNAGPTTVEVRGYTAEPYLRITRDGVDENQLSQTTYLNRSMFADTVPTGQPGASPTPAWKRIASTGTARWHDHRIHWMGRSRPPAVDADPTHPHLVGNWTIHATADGRPFDVTGTLRWLGKPASATSPAPQTWLLTLLGGLTVAVGVLTVALVRARRRPVAAHLP